MYASCVDRNGVCDLSSEISEIINELAVAVLEEFVGFYCALLFSSNDILFLFFILILE